MLAGTGHAYFWAGAGGEPPPAGATFQETLCGALKDQGRSGRFKKLAALLVAVVGWIYA